MTMQKWEFYSHQMEIEDDGTWYKVADVHAEIARLHDEIKDAKLDHEFAALEATKLREHVERLRHTLPNSTVELSDTKNERDALREQVEELAHQLSMARAEILQIEQMCSAATKPASVEIEAQEMAHRINLSACKNCRSKPCICDVLYPAKSAQMRELLIELRDAGSWFTSAVELDVYEGKDGEELLRKIEMLVGPKVAK